MMPDPQRKRMVQSCVVSGSAIWAFGIFSWFSELVAWYHVVGFASSLVILVLIMLILMVIREPDQSAEDNR